MIRLYLSLSILFCMGLTVRPDQNEFMPAQKDKGLSSLFFSKIDTLFGKYSTDRQSMNHTQMEKFLDHLIELLSNDQKKHKMFHEENVEHGHSDHDHDHGHDHSHDEHDHDEKIECLIEKFKEIKKAIFGKTTDHILDKKNFYKLTGVIMADIDFCFCNTTNLTTLNKYQKKYSIWDKEKQENWIYAFLSAFLISVIGLLCYLVVPSINTYCFNNLFQFLVALAVGTLSGDSLLHLIPHAFMEHDHDSGDSHDHSSGVYKGLGAVIGIYVFFLIERIMQIRRARKEKRHRMSELDANSEKLIHQDKIADSSKNFGQNVSAANVNANLREKDDDKTLVEPLFGKTNETSNAYTINFENSNDPACLVIHANKDLKYISQYLPNNPCDVNIDHHDSENERQHLHKHRHESKSCEIPPSEEKLKKHSHTHGHGHGHSHGHSHKHHIYKSDREKAHHDHHKKHEKELTDIKLIAWMVLMGDGLHNFADGLAIGVSFGSSLTTGFGTAIAVLCHELPHEIGDFAVLRRAGVSLKKALFFNAISGILCMFGVLVGLLIGGFEFFKNWSFLFIAGTFLYISLVDMIPELSENKEDDSIANFLIQSFGILFGVGIMFAIAVFEENIVNLFKSK